MEEWNKSRTHQTIETNEKRRAARKRTAENDIEEQIFLECTLTHTCIEAHIHVANAKLYTKKLCTLHTECPDAYWMRITMNASVHTTRSFRMCSTIFNGGWVNVRVKARRKRRRRSKWHKQWKSVYNLQCDVPAHGNLTANFIFWECALLLFLFTHVRVCVWPKKEGFDPIHSLAHSLTQRKPLHKHFIHSWMNRLIRVTYILRWNSMNERMKKRPAHTHTHSQRNREKQPHNLYTMREIVQEQKAHRLARDYHSVPCMIIAFARNILLHQICISFSIIQPNSNILIFTNY